MTIPAIPNVIAYGLSHWRPLGRRAIPLSDALTVSTRNTRVEVAHPDLGALSLTTEQSIALRERLEQAERDIDAAGSGPCEDGGELLEPGRCDCCGRAMAVGEQVATFWDERKGDVVIHAGKCPDPEMWAVAWGYGDGPVAVRLAPRPFEESYARAIDHREHFTVSGANRVRLVRVREARP